MSVDIWEEWVGWLKMEGGAKLEDSAEIGKCKLRAVPFFLWFLIAAAKKANSWIDNFLWTELDVLDPHSLLLSNLKERLR